MAFLKFILTVIVVYYAFKLLFRLLMQFVMPIVLKRMMSRMQNNNMGPTTTTHRKEGSMTIQKPQREETSSYSSEGEYVDFEEIK